MTAKEGPGSGKHIRALALAAVFAAGCLGFGRPVIALAEEVTVIGPGALIQEEEAQAAAEEAQQQEELSQEEILARQQAWAAELATLHLRYSIAGTEKPWLFYREAYEEKLKPLDRRYDLSWYKRVVREKLYTPLTQNGIRLVLMIVPDKDQSEMENRTLETRPRFRMSSILSGDFMEEWESYLSDQFVGRDTWRSLKVGLDRLGGARMENGIYIGKDGQLMEDIEVPDENQLDANLTAIRDFADTYEDIPVTMMLVPDAA